MICASSVINDASAQQRPPHQQAPPERGHSAPQRGSHNEPPKRGHNEPHKGGHQTPPPSRSHHTPPPSRGHQAPPPGSYHRPPSRPAPSHGVRVPITIHRKPAAINLRATEHRGTGLYGYLNNFGSWAIAPNYRYARDFNDEAGLAIVQLTNGAWGAINRFGETAILFSFSSWLDVDSAIRSLLKGRYRGIDLWQKYDPATELWGYLDYYGEWYITPQFKYAKDMSDRGIAIVQYPHGGWGAINRTGQVVIEPNFNSWLDVDSALRNLRY